MLKKKKNLLGRKELYSPSLVGGPGGSQPPALTLNYVKQPRDSARDVLLGSMETGDAGGLAPSWQEIDPRSCANRRRGKQLKPALQRRSAAVPAAARAGRGGVCDRSPPTRAQSSASPSQWERTVAEKAGEAGTAGAQPQPVPNLKTGSRRNFGGMEETTPESQGTLLSSKLRPFTFPAGESGMLPSGGGGDWGDDCRCSTCSLTNPGAGK